MTTGHLKIHSENILPIIKKWLYSDKDIFIRELVANACDAIHKVKLLREKGELEVSDEEFRIDLKINKEERTLQFTDTGIGMNADEVEKYIAQIAFSSAEDFMEKYQTDSDQNQIIGHFGLGFYSAYMAADTVDIDTLSYRENSEAASWSCDGSSDYELGSGKRSERGTEITLHINKDEDDFLDENHVRSILARYCTYLPIPIYLNDKRINEREPLWIKAPSECEKQDYIEFYRHLYPMEEDPLFWIHLNVDYPFNLKGILYFPKINRTMESKQFAIKLFCNRVFVSDASKEIIPDHLSVLRGAIDSPDIPLNVSRSTLQFDKTVRQVGSHISKKVADSLSSLYKSDRDRFITCWKDIELVVKLGVMQDDKFYQRVKDFLIWKNHDGSWVTVEDYLERNGEKTSNKIYYTNDEKTASQFLDIYKKQGIEVLFADRLLDTHVIGFLERKLDNVSFQRIDGAIDESIIDKDRESTLLDSEGKTNSSRLADFISGKLNDENVSVEAKSLASDSLPAFVMMDEQERRLRDFMRERERHGMEVPSSVAKQTFVVNTNSPLISSLEELNKKDAELAGEVVKDLYELSLLSQREIEPEMLNQFIERSNYVLERLTCQAVKGDAPTATTTEESHEKEAISCNK
jgi:molecular chaperone HtpG